MLPILYEFPEAMQTGGEWKDPANWPMVLPNLGRSITIDRLIADYAVSKEKGEEEERRWASQHLNVEIGLALHSDRWIGADYWEAAEDESITLDAIMGRCDVAVVGIDGGGLDDLYAAVMAGAVERVRPKMMTVVAIMAGLLPILWSSGTGSEVMRRIAAPMVGGMVSSTILTLIVIPAIYALVKEYPIRWGVNPFWKE
jgi:phage terminase large subunit-like protein